MDIKEILRDKREIFVLIGLAIPFLLLFNVLPLDTKLMDLVEWRWIIAGVSGISIYVFFTWYKNKDKKKIPPKQPTYRPPYQPAPRQPMYEPQPPEMQPKIPSTPPPPKRDIIKEFDNMKKQERK